MKMIYYINDYNNINVDYIYTSICLYMMLKNLRIMLYNRRKKRITILYGFRNK